MPLRRAFKIVGLLALLAFAAPRAGLAQLTAGPSESLRDGFEGPRTAWRQESSDSSQRVRAHERTSQYRFEGQTSERIEFVAGLGSYFYFSYPLPQIPLPDELRASVHLRSNKEGLRLLARVVLPTDIDPETGQPSYVIVQGTAYNEADRWRKLELTDLPSAVDRQVRVLRFKSGRTISIEGAYLERLVLNVYGGAGETEVFLDELTIAPVPAGVLDEPQGDDLAEADPDSPEAAGSERFQFNRNRLSIWDEPGRRFFPWVPTIIQAPGADVRSLRQHGFDVLAVREGTDSSEIESAVDVGFFLMPLMRRDERSPAELIRSIASFSHREHVAFWHLGEGIGAAPGLFDRRAELERDRAIVLGMRDLPKGTSRLVTGGVSGEWPLYAKRPGRLDLIEALLPVWGTSMDLLSYMAYLQQRRNLTGLNNPQGPFWSWVEAVPPPQLQEAVWGRDVPPGWGWAQVQPEQIRLGAYAVLSSGYRGLGFRADAELTREAGQARLIEMALLNAEVDLIESVIALGNDPIRFWPVYPGPPKQRLENFANTYDFRDTSQPETDPFDSIKAAAFETPDKRGTLLLVADYARVAHILPPKLAQEEVKLIIPGHRSATAWRLSLGGVEYLDTKPVVGGREVTLTDFNTTAIVLVTSDLELKERLAADINRVRPVAVELAIRQADHQIRWVTDTHSRLLLRGRNFEGSDTLLASARDILRGAQAAFQRGEYASAYAEARRVGQPLRILMQSHYGKAMEALNEATYFGDNDEFKMLLQPVASPPVLAFNTLPQHFAWTEWMSQYPWSVNLLSAGDFETSDPEQFESQGWTRSGYEVEGLEGRIRNVPLEPEEIRPESRRALELAVRVTEGGDVDRFPAYQEHPIVAIESPPVAVKKGQFLRISVLVKMRRGMPIGGGGLIVRDSIGGEPLQLRWTGVLPEWHRVVLYRRAPVDGDLTVTLGLATTVGEVLFDDLRIERVVNPDGPRSYPTPNASPVARSAAAAPQPTTRSPTPPLPSPTAAPDRRASATPGQQPSASAPR
ncbi:hypothetical protein BH23PLA1_BH23PLA1_08340 [soil metagenome]